MYFKYELQAREVSVAADVWRCLMTIIILGGWRLVPPSSWAGGDLRRSTPGATLRAEPLRRHCESLQSRPVQRAVQQHHRHMLVDVTALAQ